ncbi:phenylpyruvate tautomerase MIF-related protein [Desulfovibrio gilichinskyi]|uniref:L-dopachrome isomerase n=1 Tax=Desulfovibrio gilichinskyi TaxID=1519643 RepID=A0A1X7CJ20_9BACT|nr:phenylpyruvate tautomerase MIF-related protein [Desulfovibrio gilichinskyi]SME97593.1 Macrophage migration inhibitory factor (MIF) [Desulfovibrio gilichinskyi]
MPFIRVETNLKVETAEADAFVLKLSKFVSVILGKPEIYVTAILHQNASMSLSGSNEPAVFVSLASISLQSDKCLELSRSVCEFITAEFSVPGTRVFIEFRDLERSMFGWNGRTF